MSCSYHGLLPTRIWLSSLRQLVKSSSPRYSSMASAQKGVVWFSLLKFKKPKLLLVCTHITYDKGLFFFTCQQEHGQDDDDETPEDQVEYDSILISSAGDLVAALAAS